MKTFVLCVSILGILLSVASVSTAAPVPVFGGQGQHQGINPATEYDINRIPAYLAAEGWDQSAIPASPLENGVDKVNIGFASGNESGMGEVRLSSVPIQGAASLFITGLLAAGIVARKKLRNHRREAVSA